MCGIAGFWAEGRRIDAPQVLQHMADKVRHRGPDSSGVWSDASAGVGLAHRRLAIVDLSEAGHQPMMSASGRYVIVLNGEIYNHNDLRRRLDAASGHAWRGHSDTETLLAAIDAWGLEKALRESVGMFAIALWDKQERSLYLARDRFGEKPLYYGWNQGVFLFASELKSLEAFPGFRGEIDRDAAAHFLRYSYVPAPLSIWQGIHKLTPGTWMKLTQGQSRPEPIAYWSPHDAIIQGQGHPFRGTREEASHELERLLGRTLQEQMLADVPLGALLSGGVDSSTITALMQAHSARPIKTYSIGFDDPRFDESAHAAAIARHLGTEHTELVMTPKDVLETVPRMPVLYDEPFADSSQLPTSLVMALARRHVTVVLTGDAGDEMFGGYNRYFTLPRLWNTLRLLPLPLRRTAGSLLLKIPVSQWNQLGAPLAGLIRQRNFGEKVHKFSDRLQQATSLDALYLALVAEWRNAESLVIGAKTAPILLNTPSRWPAVTDPVSRMMALDTLTYMTDDVLVKVDRAAMGVALETRAPFLDHRLMEFAWRLPLSHKINGGKGKLVLRDVLYRHVPRELVERPKQGFGIPLDNWLRNELRDWAEDLLSEHRLVQGGLLQPGPIRDAWKRHLSGERAFGNRLWSVLMLQAWLTAPSRTTI